MNLSPDHRLVGPFIDYWGDQITDTGDLNDTM